MIDTSVESRLRILADAALTGHDVPVDPYLLAEAADYINELTVRLQNMRAAIQYLEQMVSYE